MRTIIAGSREINKYIEVIKAVNACGFKPTIIISGCARGADYLGIRFAQNNNLPLEKYPADWNTYGRKAGYLRNVEMAEVADALILLWDGESRGSQHMLNIAIEKNLKIAVHLVFMD